MGWAEMRLINSDYSEPLNYLSYISDLSMFGENSYVLNPQNVWLWRSLCSNSLILFGHKGLHDLLLSHLSDEDIDCMLDGDGTLQLESNTRFGQCLNALFETDVFPNGNIDAVLKEITVEKFNVLNESFQRGIIRYIAKKTAGADASVWFGQVFEIATCVDNPMSITNVAAKDDIVEEFLYNEPAMFVLCNSMIALEGTITNNLENYSLLLSEASKNPESICILIDVLTSANAIQKLYANKETLNTIISNENCMNAVIKNRTAFQTMIDSADAMEAVANSEIGAKVLIEGYAEYAKSSNSLEYILELLGCIHDKISDISEDTKLQQQILSTCSELNECLDGVDAVVTNTSVLKTNYANLLTNPTALTAIANSQIALDMIEWKMDVDFNKASMGTIAILLSLHYAGGKFSISNVWAVGDTISITLPSLGIGEGLTDAQPANTYELRIIGFDCDDCAESVGKNAVTLQFVNTFDTPGMMHHENTTEGGWVSSDRRAWLNDILYNAFPEEIKNLIKPTKVLSYVPSNGESSIVTSEDYVFLPSEGQVTGQSTFGTTYPSEGSQYPYFAKASSNKLKQKLGTTAYTEQLTRSVYTSKETDYVIISSIGGGGSVPATKESYFSPIICF